jgi:hypothetical protein
MVGTKPVIMHLDYEKLEPYPLNLVTTDGMPLSYCVEEEMRLIKDKKALRVNPSLSLAGYPAGDIPVSIDGHPGA